jgi:hypothetical protein
MRDNGFLLPMKKQFKVVPFNSLEFMHSLRDVALPYQGNKMPVGTILNQLKNSPTPCQTAVFEHDYVDEDYQDEFAAFYSKTFKRYPHRCTRIHFFRQAISSRTRTDYRRYRNGYLGFVILRPTDLQRVGRTILVPPIKSSDSQFITCQAPFQAHIYGNEFVVKAMPFIQQDTQVGACAQASLWMLARYMSERFHCREFLPSEINALAKANMALGRSLPAENGLTTIQMLDALQGMGFPAVGYMRENMDPCSHHIEAAFPIQGNTGAKKRQALELQRTAKLADIAYRYIESGLPVILGTADHAIVAVGHSYDHSVMNATVAIQRIPSFFINNDNTGPYQEMPLFTRNVKQLSFLDVRTIITVAPAEVTLKGEEAEWMAMECARHFLDEQPDPKKPNKFKDILAGVRPEFGPWFKQLECRTYLMRSVDLQREIRMNMKRKNILRTVGEKLIVLDYPKYVWITEISSPSLLNHQSMADRQCLGCVIVDSTAPARTAGVIAMHFADFFLAQDRDNPSEADRKVFLSSTPFKHRLTPL